MLNMRAGIQSIYMTPNGLSNEKIAGVVATILEEFMES
jgi:hypothetical protein